MNAKKIVQAIFYLFLNFSLFCQTAEPLLVTSRSDGMTDVYQLNDSLLVCLISSSPIILNTSFTLEQDSILNKVGIVNLNTKNTKYIPLKGTLDSFEVLLSGSFLFNNEIYFTTRRLDRLNFPTGTSSGIAPPNSNRRVYKVIGDTIQFVTHLNTNQEVYDINSFGFVNTEGEYVNVLGIPNTIHKWTIAKYNQNGTEIALSDTINAPLLRGIIQNSYDSSYCVYFADYTVHKLDKNLQSIGLGKLLVEENTSRILELPYFKSRIDDNPIFSGIQLPLNAGDSVNLVSAHISNDSVVKSVWKKLVIYEPFTIDPNNYVYNSLFNEDHFNDQFFYAYEKKQCLPGLPNCTSKFYVVKHDTLNNTHWELEFGGEAGYSVSRVLALQDSGCVVFVRRTRTNGNIDLYYVYIDKDGNVVNNFLPLLGGEELAIPVKVVFSLHPNPTTNYLSLDNTSLEKTAKRISVFDYSGKVVLEQPFEKTIDVSGLDQGTYIYRIEMESGLYHDSKFVKR